MISKEIICEANRNSVILIDFQPAYQSDDWGYNGAIESAIAYINKKKPKVTAFFNGMDVGIEDMPEEVAEHYIEHGLNPELAYRINFREKSYAWLRGWMDQGASKDVIIKVLRYLFNNDINDSRDIEKETLIELVGPSWHDAWYDDGIYIPDISISELKSLSNSLLGGGGKSECLDEIQILLNAFNIKYKLVQDWIYG